MLTTYIPNMVVEAEHEYRMKKIARDAHTSKAFQKAAAAAVSKKVDQAIHFFAALSQSITGTHGTPQASY